IKKNWHRKYLNWMIRNVEIKKNTIPNPRFWFFSKLRILYNAYKKNPWINMQVEKILTYLSQFYGVSDDAVLVKRVREDLKAERDFLLDKYLDFYLNCDKCRENTELFDKLTFVIELNCSPV
uniref:Uncharacterized protein LOC113784810 n=1 Tax=Cicer arietinum TaxID=3827 RepID=A0A3Q7Y7B3_CICAR